MYDTPFDNKYHLNINLFSDPKVLGDISLYRIGRVYCKDSTVVPRHTHLNFFEMTIVTSDTLTNCFRNRRLETARLLLLEGAMSVTRISALLNYSSVYIFSRAFKEKYGVPPSKLKKSKAIPAPV